MKYDHINDVAKLKQIKQEKRNRIQRENEEIKILDLRIAQIKFESENQLKMTI